MKKFLFITSLSILTVSIYAEVDIDTSQIVLENIKRIDLIKTNLDFVWVLISAMLVFFMQAGFMALESGMARSKNSINVAIKNLTDFVLGIIGFWIIGFGFMFGKSYMGIIGTTDFMINISDPWTAVFFIFQAVFVGTAATIDSGAVCGRTKLKQYILLSFLVSTIIYPIFGHWVWGSFLHGTDPQISGAGWLEAMGFKDFAGSSVVHSVGGWVALAGVIVVGPRIGRFENGKAVKIHPGDMRFVFLGIFILFFGWFGFNCGSTLSANSDIAIIALNTMMSACFACLSASLLSWFFHPEKKIDGEMIANGVLAGLVGITAGCAFVDVYGAIIIGLISGIIVFSSSIAMEKVFKLDDVVGAVPVHAICGAWGTFAVGIFITPEMLGNMSRLDQIKVQGLGVVVCFLWAFLLGLLFYSLVDKFLGGVRVTREEEIMGLNIAEHGATSSIIELSNTMDELTRSGNFRHQSNIHVEEGTETGDLAKLFNKMIIKVKEALKESEKQKSFAELMLAESELQKKKVIDAQNTLATREKETSIKRSEYINETRGKLETVTTGIESVKCLMTKTSDVSNSMVISFQDLVSTLKLMLENSNGIHSKLDQMHSITRSTTNTATNTKLTVNNLKYITEEIGEMVSLINDIADKTHILSINSSIEAARTGDVGKGFMIIGKEIRALSQQTTTTADNIGLKLTDVNKKVDAVTNSLEQILNIVGEISSLNTSISTIVTDSYTLSNKLQNSSEETIIAVEHMSGDINNVLVEAGQLSNIGKQVEKELSDLS